MDAPSEPSWFLTVKLMRPFKLPGNSKPATFTDFSFSKAWAALTRLFSLSDSGLPSDPGVVSLASSGVFAGLAIGAGLTLLPRPFPLGAFDLALAFAFAFGSLALAAGRFLPPFGFSSSCCCFFRFFSSFFSAFFCFSFASSWLTIWN